MANPAYPRWRDWRKCVGGNGENYIDANISKFLLRHGLAFDERTPTGRRKGNWTRAHWSWIESIRFAEGADNDVLAYYVDAVRRAAEEKARLEGLVEAEARKPRWRRRVDSLRCC